jgi:tetratricopeptide (TPR) repeat protein
VRKYGKDDPDSIGFAEDLSLIYRSEDSWSEAEPLAEELVQISTRQLGPEHSDTLKRKGQLAVVYKQLERWEKSEELFSELFVTRKNLDGVGNMETLAAGTQLFDVYRQEQKWSDAVRLLKELVNLAERGFGPDKSVTLMCLAQLATCLAAQGDSDQAIFVHNQALFKGQISPRCDTRHVPPRNPHGWLATREHQLEQRRLLQRRH